LVQGGRPEGRVEDNGAQVFAIPRGIGGNVCPTVRSAVIINQVVAQSGTNRIDILRNVAGAVSAIGISELRGARCYRGVKRRVTILEVRANDRSRKPTTPIVNQQEVVYIEVCPKKTEEIIAESRRGDAGSTEIPEDVLILDTASSKCYKPAVWFVAAVSWTGDN
jgi:hypothetical protein